jgi:hypothetical protein
VFGDRAGNSVDRRQTGPGSPQKGISVQQFTFRNLVDDCRLSVFRPVRDDIPQPLANVLLKLMEPRRSFVRLIGCVWNSHSRNTRLFGVSPKGNITAKARADSARLRARRAVCVGLALLKRCNSRCTTAWVPNPRDILGNASGAMELIALNPSREAGCGYIGKPLFRFTPKNFVDLLSAYYLSIIEYTLRH